MEIILPHVNCCGGMPCAQCKPILDSWRDMSHAEWTAKYITAHETKMGKK